VPRVIQCFPIMNKRRVTSRVAFFASALTQDPPRIEEGILHYISEHPGFTFRSFRFNSERFDSSDAVAGLADLPLPWEDWRPDGIIAQLGACTPDVAAWLGQAGQPLINTGAEWIGRLPCVYTTPQSVANLAVEHFLTLGLKHFAFVGLNVPSSRLRWEAFERKLRTAGHVPLLLELETNPLSGLAEVVEKASHELGLLQLLRQAPKPLALFTPGEYLGHVVCSACRRLNLDVPEHVAVVTTGNGPAARTCLPPLTAIHTPAEEAGYQAMALLHRMLRDGKDRSCPTIEVPATWLTVRGSTQNFDEETGNAQRLKHLIRDHACLGLTFEQIAAPMEQSRSTLQRQFVAAFGTTPGQEMLRVRLEKAKELLGTAQPLKAIAASLGYATPSGFILFFRKQTGMTPQEYRQRARAQNSKAQA
jgi:LacI family transcriptional regulator